MSPLEVEILLHYHCTNTDFRDLNAPAIRDAINEFVAEGILIRNDLIEGKVKEGLEKTVQYYADREATQPFVDAVCAVPCPRRVWVISEPEHVPVPDGQPAFLRKILD